MSLIGEGRIFPEDRVELSGRKMRWYAVAFVDDYDGHEKVVARFAKRAHALTIKARYEKETCAVTVPPPVKFSMTNGVKMRAKADSLAFGRLNPSDGRFLKTKGALRDVRRDRKSSCPSLVVTAAEQSEKISAS